MIFLFVLIIAAPVFAPPPPPGGGGPGGPGGPGGGGGMSVSGESPSTLCPSSVTSCSNDGSSNFYIPMLHYDPITGKFQGSIVTNQCANHPYGYYNGVLTDKKSSASCVNQTIPAPDYANTPVKAPLRGRAGVSISGGVNLFTPLEAGFTSGMVCSTGSCQAGLDLEVCELKLKKECTGGILTNADLLLDDCNAHASPYHHHKDMRCNYNSSNNDQHSPLIAVAMDGRGIYGKWEANGALPSDLDACNGHYGDVPAYSDGKQNYPAATNVYHYHTSDTPPYTLGCFGPVQNLTHCKSLYSTCNTGFETFCTTKGEISYDTDCPCFSQGQEKYNQNYISTPTCPCGSPANAPTLNPPTTLQPTDSTNAPTLNPPSSMPPSTLQPTDSPSTIEPSNAPTLLTIAPSTKSPTTMIPTLSPTNINTTLTSTSENASHLDTPAGKSFIGSLVSFIFIGIAFFYFFGFAIKKAGHKNFNTQMDTSESQANKNIYLGEAYRVLNSYKVSAFLSALLLLDTICDIEFSARLRFDDQSMYDASIVTYPNKLSGKSAVDEFL
jgi:hypothetical protein